jgi:putative hydrolase of the HAD superfamily
MSVGPGSVGKSSKSGWAQTCMGSTYKTIIFDVNGTLLGYEDPLGFEKRFAAACQDLGAQVSPDDVQRAMAIVVQQWSERKQTGNRRASSGEQYRRSMTWFYQALLKALGVPGDSGQQADSLYERFIIREGFMPPFNEVRETLARLRARGLRLGILSNFPPHCEDALKCHGLHGYFDFFVVSSLVGLEKPDAAIFELAIEKAGCPRDEILYVGDDLYDDIRGARSVGLATILTDRHNRWPEADCLRIKSLSELLEPRLFGGITFSNT